jgi:hypothetical protein
MIVIEIIDAQEALSVLSRAVEGLVIAKRDGWWEEAVEAAYQPMITALCTIDAYLTGSMHNLPEDQEVLRFITLGEDLNVELSDDVSQLNMCWPNEENTMYIRLVQADHEVQGKWDQLCEKGDNHVRI